MERRPAEWLAEGSLVIAPILEGAGFRIGTVECINGSGGASAHVSWCRGAQYVETHVRSALGIVLYGREAESFAHRDYMRWRGVRGEYPGFSDDPIDGFRHLATTSPDQLRPF